MAGHYPSKRTTRRAKKQIEAGLILTSLLDIFILLVFYLLKSYSAEGQLISLPNDLVLPASTSQVAPRVAVQLLLTATTIQVDGVSLNVDVKAAETSDEMLIRPLLDHLKQLADQYQAISSQNASVTFTGDMILEGDKNIPFRLLKKVLYTAGQAGFINQSLAVYNKGG